MAWSSKKSSKRWGKQYNQTERNGKSVKTQFPNCRRGLVHQTIVIWWALCTIKALQPQERREERETDRKNLPREEEVKTCVGTILKRNKKKEQAVRKGNTTAALKNYPIGSNLLGL